MNLFSQLSTELVLSILEKVFPENLVSFSISCKDIYDLSSARLKEHRPFNQQYRRNWNGVEHEPDRLRRQAGVVRELLFSFHKDTVVDRYVRSMEAVAWLSEFADWTVLQGVIFPAGNLPRTR